MFQKNNSRVKIVCAACKLDDLIVCGARHYDKMMNIQIEACGRTGWPKAEQGFIDQFGNFYSRVEAYNIIERNKLQVIDKNNGSKVELYSEGLY